MKKKVLIVSLIMLINLIFIDIVSAEQYNNYTSATVSCGGDLLTKIPSILPSFSYSYKPHKKLHKLNNPHYLPHNGEKRKTDFKRSPFFMERLTRLELATSTLARWRSTG